jgi:MFS family permease
VADGTEVSSAGSRRTVLLLTGCLALAMTGNAILGTTAAIVGNMLSLDKALSTLPVAFNMTGTMAATIPAALLMARIGRRGGFWTGAAIGFAGAVTGVLAILARSFPLFCAGTFLLGANFGFAQQYRFAAAEIADESFRSKAVSLVLSGGIASALFGPQMARWSAGLLAPASYAGCYAVIACLALAAAGVLCFVALPPAPPPAWRSGGRSLREIALQPRFVIAVLAGMAAYGAMALVMTATPLAMLGCGFGFADAAFVIQWHALGMYVPSFFTGRLIDRCGIVAVMLTGVLLLLACGALNLTGASEAHFWSALVLLGIGWNFLFVGATTLIAATYGPAEKAKAQGLNDFLVFGTVALASVSSGALLSGPGWKAIQLALLPFAALAALAVLRLQLAAAPAGRIRRVAEETPLTTVRLPPD